MTSGGWRVVLLNDDVNTFEGATYALHRLAGLSVADAWYQAQFVHERGSAVVRRFADQDAAELLTAKLQVFGLHAVVRHG